MTKAVLTALASTPGPAWCIQPKLTFSDRDPQSLGVASQRDHTKYVNSFNTTLEGLRIVSFLALPGALVINIQVSNILESIHAYMSTENISFVEARNQMFYRFFEPNETYTTTRVFPTTDRNVLDKHVLAILKGFAHCSGGVFSTRENGKLVKKLNLNNSVHDAEETLWKSVNVTPTCNTYFFRCLINQALVTYPKFVVQGESLAVSGYVTRRSPYPSEWDRIIVEAARTTLDSFRTTHTGDPLEQVLNQFTPAKKVDSTTTTTAKPKSGEPPWNHDEAKERYLALKQRYKRNLVFYNLCNKSTKEFPMLKEVLDLFDKVSFDKSWKMVQTSGGAYLDSLFMRTAPENNKIMNLDLSVNQEFEACAEWFSLTSALYNQLSYLTMSPINKSKATFLTSPDSVVYLRDRQSTFLQNVLDVFLVWLDALKLKLTDAFTTYKSIHRLVNLIEMIDVTEREIKLQDPETLESSHVSKWLSAVVETALANNLPALLKDLYGQAYEPWFYTPPRQWNIMVRLYQSKHAQDLQAPRYNDMLTQNQQIKVEEIREVNNPRGDRNPVVSDQVTLDVEGINKVLNTLSHTTKSSSAIQYMDSESPNVNIFCLCKVVSELAIFNTANQEVNVYVKLVVTPSTKTVDNGFWVAPQEYNSERPTMVVNIQRSITSQRNICNIVRIDCIDSQTKNNMHALSTTTSPTPRVEPTSSPTPRVEPKTSQTPRVDRNRQTIHSPNTSLTIRDDEESDDRLVTSDQVPDFTKTTYQINPRAQLVWSCLKLVGFVAVLGYVIYGFTQSSVENIVYDVSDELYKSSLAGQFEHLVANIPVLSQNTSTTLVKCWLEICKRLQQLAATNIIEKETPWVTVACYIFITVVIAWTHLYGDQLTERSMKLLMAVVNSVFITVVSYAPIKLLTIASVCVAAICTVRTLTLDVQASIENSKDLDVQKCLDNWGISCTRTYTTKYERINNSQIEFACQLPNKQP